MTHSVCSVMFADNHTAGMKRASVSQYASKLLRYLSMVYWDNMQEEGEIPGCAAAMILGTYENSACMQAKLLQFSDSLNVGGELSLRMQRERGIIPPGLWTEQRS